MKEKEMVTIPKYEYDQLCESKKWLSYLEEAGVDNWEGYGIAYQLMKESGVYDE